MFRKLIGRIPGVRRLRTWCNAPLRLEGLLAGMYAASIGRYREELLSRDRYANPRRLNAVEASVFSQTGADGILQEIFRRIGVTDRTFVEIGTESGIETNSTFLLWQEWSGWWVEGDAKHAASARSIFRGVIGANRLRIVEAFVTAENIEGTLDAAEVPTIFDLLSVDIDRNTYWVLKAIRRRPRVIVVEYNAAIPPAVEWTVDYNPQKVWNGTAYFGASLKAYETLCRGMGYRLVGCDLAGFNAFFVRDDLAGDRFLDPPSAENHYEPARSFLASRYGHPPCFAD